MGIETKTPNMTKKETTDEFKGKILKDWLLHLKKALKRRRASRPTKSSPIQGRRKKKI